MSLDAMKQALEALEEMKAEFRALDLPYGSEAYTKANNSTHVLRVALSAAIEEAQPNARAHHKMMIAMTKEHWRSIDHQWKDDPELCHAMGYEAGYKDAVAPRAEPRASESGAGFESLPASPTWWHEPAQMNYRKWQGLTADEIWQCNAAPPESAVEYHICMAHQNVLDFAEAIEAKLREKNT